MNLTPIRTTPGMSPRTAILQHSRKLDDFIQLARKVIKAEPATPVTVAVESLLKEATEEYFTVNEAALMLPDTIENLLTEPAPARDAEAKV